METENLSNYFKGIAVKRLSAVEAGSDSSTQHEFNGNSGLKNIFGKDKRIFETKLIYLGEKDEDAVTTDGLLTLLTLFRSIKNIFKVHTSIF